MRINPIECESKAAHLLVTNRLSKLYKKIDALPNHIVRYDGKDFSGNDIAVPCEAAIKHWWEEVDAEGNPTENYTEFSCPFGAVSDFLWVQEPWIAIEGRLYFEAELLSSSSMAQNDLLQIIEAIGWRSATTLEFLQARILLKITDLEVVNINDIWLWKLTVTRV